MFQAIGLTKSYRRGRPPALFDVSFDAREGQVTALLGPEDSGRSTTLRLALGLESGQGVALFDGRTYRRIRRPEREVGTVLGAPGRPAGHPGRRARAHLRMMAAAAGVPARRADQLLEQTRLAPAAGHRLRTFSPGMTRRLALAEALLGDPGTLLLDEPTHGLSPKNTEWFHAFLRAFAAGGGSVLVTVRSPQEAAALADRVVTLDGGRLLADQPIAEFLRTRLRAEVSVCGPQVGRLADLLAESGALVRREGGARISVSGATRTEIGELAFRHGILLHELADHVVEAPPQQRVAHAAAPVPQAAGRVTPHVAAPKPAPKPAPEADAGARVRSDSGETVVVLTPGTAVSASVAGPATTSVRNRLPAGFASVSGPLYRDEPAPPDDRIE
ncbi:ABC-2 type transport system ATP-binding protein [Streptacidiphilus sp. MAP12-16]|uniref:ABC transporter ATP-binding protein n=1 Tax=Streptacidiphilus sp. MAP12-16 TaxID=3156300 RepID=UPI0035162354